MNNPDIKEIIRLWLTDNGYDGLCNGWRECGCDLTDFVSCNNFHYLCKAAYKVQCDCTDECEFIVMRTMPPGETEEQNIDQTRGHYKEGDLDKFFGCAPGITDGLSPREYIEKVRDEGEIK